MGDRHLAETAPGVEPQDAEARAGRGGSTHGGRVRGVGVFLPFPGHGDVDKAGLQLGVGDLLEHFAYRADGAEGSQALLRIVAVLLEVRLDQCLKQGEMFYQQAALLLKDLSEGFALVEYPGVHGGEGRITW